MRYALGRAASLRNSAAHSRVAYEMGTPYSCARFFSDGSVLVLRTSVHDLCMTQPQYSRCFSFCYFPGSLNVLYNQSESWVGQELEIQNIECPYLRKLRG